jgi:hypothetical protein
MEEGREDEDGRRDDCMNWLIMVVWVIGALLCVLLARTLSRV